jgi:hypothetical protein
MNDYDLALAIMSVLCGSFYVLVLFHPPIKAGQKESEGVRIDHETK